MAVRFTAREVVEALSPAVAAQTHPAQHIAQQRTFWLMGWPDLMPDIPGLHGQRIPARPEPDEMNAKHDEREGRRSWRVVQGDTRLRQGAEQVAERRYHAEQQHALTPRGP